jgi:glycosyltransferase involved in cell wall biosynthesis
MGITVDKVDDGLPISVIIPLSKKRRDFFNNFVLPLIEANNPKEIIVNDNEGSAPKKRNEGFRKASQPYLFFCDDDIILPANALERLYEDLVRNQKRSDVKIGYSYCGYHGIVLHPETHPMRGNFEIPSKPFDASALRQANYISTMTLINKEVFPGFDENLKRLQDWDIFLTMLKNGINGVFVPDIKFHAYYLDQGITSNTNNERDAVMAIIRKHNIGVG